MFIDYVQVLFNKLLNAHTSSQKWICLVIYCVASLARAVFTKNNPNGKHLSTETSEYFTKSACPSEQDMTCMIKPLCPFLLINLEISFFECCKCPGQWRSFLLDNISLSSTYLYYSSYTRFEFTETCKSWRRTNSEIF